MINSVLLFLHISGGGLGILTGMAALIPRKGSPIHMRIGNLFFYSMIVMTVSATYLAMFKEGSWINSIAGMITFYMVITARRAATNKEGKSGITEFAGAAYIFAILVTLIVLILDVSQTGPKPDGVYVEAYYMFGVIVTLAFALDVKVLIKGGVYGAQRVARHLWRMCIALYIATASFFLGQQQVFPESMQGTFALAVPVIVVIAAMLFWVIRVFLMSRFRLSKAKVKSSDQIVAT